MKYSKRFKKMLLIILFWAVLAVSFLFFAFLIVLKANGYQLNYKTWHVIKTGMIILNGEPKDVTIRINHKTLKTGFPERLSNLTIGTYDIEISRENYQGWSKTVNVEPSLALIHEDIILFRNEPSEQDLSENITVDKLRGQFSSAARDLRIEDSEIFLNDILVTRFSQKILAATMYPDNKHIVFQTGSELRVIDIDGSNNKLLINLESAEPSVFSFTNKGSTIIYLDEGILKARNIR